MIAPGLLLHPDLDAPSAREVAALDPSAAWAGAQPLPGGRGTVRRFALAGRELLLKRESRGGWAGRLLPALYLCREPFLREWALSLWLEAKGVTPPLWARWFLPRGGVFEVFTLMEPLPEVLSLADLLRSGTCAADDLRRAGECVGHLHGLGVVHGDLNAGNLLLAPARVWAIDWRHSSREESLSPAARRTNLDRLARSLVKVAGDAGPLGEGTWRSLAEGYGEGFGAADPWLVEWTSGAGRVCPLRRWLWRHL